MALPTMHMQSIEVEQHYFVTGMYHVEAIIALDELASTFQTKSPVFMFFDREGLHGEVLQFGFLLEPSKLIIFVFQQWMPRWFSRLLQGHHTVVIGYGMSSDIPIMQDQYNTKLEGLLDLQFMASIAMGRATPAMDDVCELFLGKPKSEFKKQMATYDWGGVLSVDALKYAIDDIALMLMLARQFTALPLVHERVSNVGVSTTQLLHNLMSVADNANTEEGERKVNTNISNIVLFSSQQLIAVFCCRPLLHR